MVTNRIACFLTCGYTEAGAMQTFLKKINSHYEYKQFLPNKTIKKKGDPKTISRKISGLTGQKLLEKTYSILEKNSSEIKACSAILIEDDLDGKFHNMNPADILSYEKSIKENIYSILGCRIPVFLFYASPEIESWFIADWKNGFGYIYRSTGCVTDISSHAKHYFSHHLKQYLNTYILKEYKNDIESYGYFGQAYYKLSDQIISAIQTDVKEYISLLPNVNQEYANQIASSRNLHYSKKLHGDRMLKNINPYLVAAKCRRFFFPAFDSLAHFHSSRYNS